ncbi:MAG: PilZ domain-containing protein [Nitrospira sp.]|nr:PilZ domain-containing protein [Nitrospira sp.]
MDLRRYQRFPVRLQSVLSGSSRNEWAGTIVDLSKGGCRIETNAQVYAGMQISLRIEIAGGEVPILVARAGIRWNRPNLVGGGFHFRGIASPRTTGSIARTNETQCKRLRDKTVIAQH